MLFGPPVRHHVRDLGSAIWSSTTITSCLASRASAPRNWPVHGYHFAGQAVRPTRKILVCRVRRACVDGLPVVAAQCSQRQPQGTAACRAAGVIRDLRARFGLAALILWVRGSAPGHEDLGEQRGGGGAGGPGLSDRRCRGVPATRSWTLAAWCRGRRRSGCALRQVSSRGGRARQPKKNGSQVQEVTGKGSETRRFLVHSPERERHERKLRKKRAGESAQALGVGCVPPAGGGPAASSCGGLAKRVEEAGRERPAGTKAAQGRSPPRLPGGRASSESGRRWSARSWTAYARSACRRDGSCGANHGHRYYEWRLDEAGQLEYGRARIASRRGGARGTGCCQTPGARAGSGGGGAGPTQDLVARHGRRQFRTMKDVLELRTWCARTTCASCAARWTACRRPLPHSTARPSRPRRPCSATTRMPRCASASGLGRPPTSSSFQPTNSSPLAHENVPQQLKSDAVGFLRAKIAPNWRDWLESVGALGDLRANVYFMG